MSQATLILGGARSGKTRRALEIAVKFKHRIYIATAQARDDEMCARIAHHRAERGAGWTTIEAPLDLVSAVAGADAPDQVVVIDCLTLWLSNLMEHGRDLTAETEALIGALSVGRAQIILVSNEVGLGVVPETPLGREFRDAQGRLNQRVAAAASCVEFIAAGLSLRLKG